MEDESGAPDRNKAMATLARLFDPALAGLERAVVEVENAIGVDLSASARAELREALRDMIAEYRMAAHGANQHVKPSEIRRRLWTMRSLLRDPAKRSDALSNFPLDLRVNVGHVAFRSSRGTASAKSELERMDDLIDLDGHDDDALPKLIRLVSITARRISKESAGRPTRGPQIFAIARLEAELVRLFGPQITEPDDELSPVTKPVPFLKAARAFFMAVDGKVASDVHRLWADARRYLTTCR